MIARISINARRWFRKSYGNTYHRVRIEYHKDGEALFLDSGVHYGYGDCWNQTALELFSKAENIEIPKYDNGNKMYSYLTRWAEENCIPCISYCTDVSREKDL